ncbi:MAG: glucose-specific PTS transporter subunit IIBC [Oligoflexus sp.]
MIWKTSFDFLQKIGKSLMLPVAILPVAGILLGLGGALLSGVDRGVIQIDSEFLLVLFAIFRSSGEPIFANLPLIFAVGVALGLTKNDGVSALAAIVGYVVMLGTMGVIAPYWGVETQEIMGIASINTGVFGGIIIGSVAAAVFNKFYKLELPPFLGFFAGKRSVPIITAFAAIGLGGVLSLIWPPIGEGIRYLSNLSASGDMTATVFIYGVIERLLIPFGLHHIWNVPFFFEIGEFVTSTGNVVHGELTRFFAGDPTAGNLGGGYLFKMFGLPAAAIAMWHCARPENRKKVGGIMISAALTSFVTGITEPIEFAFLFVAPVLYLIHALLAGLAFVISYGVGAKLGYTFSHGFIDYALFFAMATKPWVVLVLGPMYFLVYYASFRFAIKKWNLLTPGRENQAEAAQSVREGDSLEVASQITAALGGAKNILNLDACITRLRVGVEDMNKVNDQELRNLGAIGVIKLGNSLQAIFGTQSENLKTAIEEYLRKSKGSFTPPEVDVSQSLESVYQEAQTQNLSGLENTELIKEKCQAMLSALGGRDNIVEVKSCAQTRLRVELKDGNLVNHDLLEKITHGMQASQRIWHLLVGFQNTEYQQYLMQSAHS